MMRRLRQQEVIRPGLLIAVAAVAVAVLAYVVVNLFVGGGGGKSASQTTSTTTNVAPQPLPNLDYKVVVGNSLLGFPFKSARVQRIEELTWRSLADRSELRSSTRLMLRRPLRR